MCESEADAKFISGKWVLEPHKARYALRSFEENVKDGDVFASTTMTASERKLLSQATGYTVFTADVKTAFLNAYMKDGDVVTHPSGSLKHWIPAKGTVIWKLQQSAHGLRRAVTLARPSGADPQEVRLRPAHDYHLPVN